MLSVVTVSGSGTVVAHVRIKHSPGQKFSLEKIGNTGSFDSLQELIEGCASKLNLRKPPARKYEYAVWGTLQDELASLELAVRRDGGREEMSSSGVNPMEMSGGD